MLDNRKISPSIEETLKSIPLDDEAERICGDISHQTKVKIYDKKCKGCGYMRVEVGETEHFLVFSTVEEGIDCAQRTGLPMRRTCEYPTNIEIVYDKEVYPSLTQIVINGCKLWHIHNIES